MKMITIQTRSTTRKTTIFLTLQVCACEAAVAVGPCVSGSARIVLANRKFGKNGYIRSGRVFAQSTQPVGELKSANVDAHVVAATKKSDGKKTNTKGKKALRREKKKQEDVHRLA